MDIRKACVGVIFSTGTDWVLPSQAEHFVHSMDTLSNAWSLWYPKYAPGDTVLEGLEEDAREAKKGLWVDPQPVPPWELRRRRD